MLEEDGESMNEEEDALILEPKMHKSKENLQEEVQSCFKYLSRFRKMCAVAIAAFILTQYKQIPSWY